MWSLTLTKVPVSCFLTIYYENIISHFNVRYFCWLCEYLKWAIKNCTHRPLGSPSWNLRMTLWVFQYMLYFPLFCIFTCKGGWLEIPCVQFHHTCIMMILSSFQSYCDFLSQTWRIMLYLSSLSRFNVFLFMYDHCVCHEIDSF